MKPPLSARLVGLTPSEPISDDPLVVLVGDEVEGREAESKAVEI